MTERPTSNVIAFAVKRLEEDIENGVVKGRSQDMKLLKECSLPIR